MLMFFCFGGYAVAEDINYDKNNDEISIWVPNKTLTTGDIITKDDLDSISVKTDSIPNNAITDDKELIGMQVKRTLRQNSIVRKNSISAPMIIKKKDIITVSLETPQIQLTVQGQAMDDGSIGDAIRVMNLSSKKIITAIVTGDKTAKVVINSNSYE